MAINPLAIGGTAVVAVAAVSGGIYASVVLTKSNDQDSSNAGDKVPKMPTDWRALSKDESFSNSYGDNSDIKYGKTYGRFLVGVTVAANQEDTNDKWWDWAFTNRYQKNSTKAKGKFAGLTKATEDGSLKAICKAAYGEKVGTGDEKIKTTENGITNDQFLEENIWLFCSASETKIKTIKEAIAGNNTNPYGTDNNGNDKYGKKYETDLMNIEGNGLFWEKRLEDLKATTDTSITSPSKFHVTDRSKLTLEELKNKCEEAYKQEEGSNNTTYPKNDVYKFCSLKGSV